MPPKSRALTLIELLIVCMIITSAFAAVGVVSYTFYAKIRFQRAFSQVAETVKEKRLQALVSDKDIAFTLTWPGDLFFNGQKTASIAFHVYSNGVIRPIGHLVLRMEGYESALKIS